MTYLILSVLLAMGTVAAIDSYRRGQERQVQGWWRLEPVAWFLIVFLLGAIGAVIYRLVRRFRDRQPSAAGWAGAGQEQIAHGPVGQAATRSYLSYPPRPQDGRPEPRIVYPATQ
ncbi:hypothetical protein KIH74_04635 [Kineosporia sp. J2-2]|uniref:Cardiolipin synthase N-terminal domain-containing protein n=1 Tax=Kineosporia corallincola TaxID=2835133 RepID=A0ABS5TAV7_9ACTN|nr:hypothetical protein [Kineosporia corallincola]MBT0768196.1 hypothetical protein [Kineosporia corallincola]